MTAILGTSLFLFSTAISLRNNNADKSILVVPLVLLISVLLLLLEISLTMPGTTYVYHDMLNRPDALIHPNEFNRTIVLITLFTFPAIIPLYSLNSLAKWKNIALVLSFATLLLILLLTAQSQAALLGFIAGGFAMLINWRNKIFTALLGMCLIIYMLALPFVVQPLFQNYAEQINEMPVIGMDAGHGAQRLEIYDFVVEKIFEKPWSGHGIDTTESIPFETKGIYRYHGQNVVHIQHPHSYVLQLWLEFGLLGVMAGATLLLFLLYKIHMMAPGFAQRACMGGYICLLTILSLTYDLWHGWGLGAGVMLAAYYSATLQTRKEYNHIKSI